MKKYSSATAWIAVLVLVIFALMLLLQGNPTSNNISFDKFNTYWVNGKIDSVTIQEDDGMSIITGQLKDEQKTQYETIVSTGYLNKYLDKVNLDGVKINYLKPQSFPIWVSLLPNIILIVVVMFVLFMFMQQSGGGGGGRGVMNFGKSKAKMAMPDAKKVNFNDVAGAEEEKAELAEIVDFLRQPKRYTDMGARIPKGVLLVGPPGTGKTLLAKAVAGEAGVPFFSISGSDFVEMFVGVGASRVRDLFEQAKKNAPCIIFIDEIDAVGRQRGAGVGGGHDEREQTLNQLLVEMDGFAGNEGIIMIAATNRPDILDPALLRPGRFDRQIVVGAPDVKGREEILKVHTRKKPLSKDIDLKVVAKKTPGFTGADLENLMNEAALLAVRKRKRVIEMDELEEASTRVIAGPQKKSRIISEKERRLTAYHEAGHAITMRYLEHSDPVHQISIIPRGRAGGYTMNLPTEDRSYMSKSRLLDDMVGLLGGRVAEQIILGDISTGAKNDIDRMSSIARKMVMDFGMSENIGTISFGTGHEEVFMGRDFGHERNYSEETAARIDAEVLRLSDEAYKRAEAILSEHIDQLHSVAKALLDREQLEGDEFEAILQGKDLDKFIEEKEAKKMAALKQREDELRREAELERQEQLRKEAEAAHNLKEAQDEVANDFGIEENKALSSKEDDDVTKKDNM